MILYRSSRGAVIQWRGPAGVTSDTLAPRLQWGVRCSRNGRVRTNPRPLGEGDAPTEEATTNSFAGARVVWKGRINKRWWLRDEDQEEDEPPNAIKKAARAIEKLAKADASPEKIERVIAPIVAAEPRIDWQAYFDQVAANLAAQQEQMREARRVQLAYIVAQAARVAQDEDDIEALLMLL